MGGYSSGLFGTDLISEQQYQVGYDSMWFVTNCFFKYIEEPKVFLVGEECVLYQLPLQSDTFKFLFNLVKHTPKPYIGM